MILRSVLRAGSYCLHWPTVLDLVIQKGILPTIHLEGFPFSYFYCRIGSMNDIRLDLGASSYFSRPAKTLDPNLFEGEHLHPDVRDTILRIFMDYMASRYHNPHEWAMVWLAGSGISFQWAADRGNGDLD